jgi:hypothetical protein
MPNGGGDFAGLGSGVYGSLVGPSYAPSDLEGALAQDYNVFQNYGLYEQLGTFGTNASNAWSWAVDFTNPASFSINPYSATGIAGVGYQFGAQTGIGGYMSDLLWSYTPNQTSNVTFDYANGSWNSAGYYQFNSNSGSFEYNPSNAYYVSDWDNYNFGYSPSYSLDFGGLGADYFADVLPVLLDLDGDGLEITPLSSSNMFFDMAGDGRQNRTAWAGAGDGVLVFDVDGDGQITERNEVVFTDWDPTPTDDMAALRHVFDTDNDGTLDAGDAQFASFKVLVTNADGTTTLTTLAEAGITSINLIPDATRIVLPDGSTIDGQTTFARSGGGTGTAAAVTLMADMAGYILEQTVTHNSDGSTTIDNTTLNPDGSVAYEIIGVTSADGNTRTLSVDGDGDGVIDQVQTTATVTNGDGSTTETLTNRNGASVLLDRTVTTTSSDRKTISIGRDATGDGLNDQTETRVTAADGSTTITVSDLNPDGSLKSKTTSTTSANGLTRAVQVDLDGNATNDVTETDATVVNGDGSRTQTVSKTNKDGSLRDKSVTETSADGRSKTTRTDLNGDGVNDLLYACAIALLADGTSVSTETTTGNDGTLRDKTVTTLSADGLSRTVESDITGDGLFDTTMTDVTVVGGDGSRTQTVSVFNRNGSLREKTVTDKEADGRSRTIQSDVTGDGSWDRVETIAVDGAGATVDTISVFNEDGSLNNKVVRTTSADGLTVTTQTDLDHHHGAEQERRQFPAQSDGHDRQRHRPVDNDAKRPQRRRHVRSHDDRRGGPQRRRQPH